MHFTDMKKLEKEDEVMEAIRSLNIPAGNYMFPYTATKQEQMSEAHQEKYKQGPRGLLNIWDMPNMGLNMGYTVVFFLITSAIIGYVTYAACPPDGANTTFWNVFRIAGTIGVLTHGSSGILNGIWFKRRIITDIVDGIVYGLILGLIFALLWPYAA